MSGTNDRRSAARDRRGDAPVPHAGRYAYDGLQRVLHEKARLGIMTSLISQAEPLAFSDLKELCALSDGNLNRHLDVLREAGFVKIEKTGGGRAARSTCHLTDVGRESFSRYLSELERVIADASDRQRKLAARPGTTTTLGIEF